MVLRTITGARTPVCLLTAIDSVEADTPPFVTRRGTSLAPAATAIAAFLKIYFYSRQERMGSQEAERVRKAPPAVKSFRWQNLLP